LRTDGRRSPTCLPNALFASLHGACSAADCRHRRRFFGVSLPEKSWFDSFRASGNTRWLFGCTADKWLLQKGTFMAQSDQRFEQLKQKYQSVQNAMAQYQVRLQNLNMQGDKLFMRAEAPSEDAKNKVWDQIKMIDSSYSDLIV